MPEGSGKEVKSQPSSPPKVKAHMLRTGPRSSDSDEGLVYNRAHLVRVREDPPSEAIKMEKTEMLESDEGLPSGSSPHKDILRYPEIS